MRSYIRTIVVLALAVALIALFLHNVDLGSVAADIIRAKPGWLLLSLATMFVNLAIRAWRWKYLLEPLGTTTFAGAFRATAVGFAASTVLPARAGEVIRPYFLARQARHTDQAQMSATGAFATIIVERLLDILTVLVLLAVYVFLFDRDLITTNPVAVVWLKWIGATAGLGSLAALAILFFLAGDPERIGRAVERFEHVAPSRVAGLLARVAEKFARGLGVIRRPRRLFVALMWSFPLWLSIAAGLWAVAIAFGIALPFSGSFLIIALLSIGVSVPTPGAVGGFHAAYRYGATAFFGAHEDAAVGAAIVAHVLSQAPSLFLGLFFAAQEGLNLSGMQRLAREQGHTV
jgi:hypothetical protein